MNLNEELVRIKKLMFENYSDIQIIFDGNLNEDTGLQIKIVNENQEVIGSITMCSYNLGREIDSDLKNFNTSSKTFNNDNSIYSHSLHIYPNFRRMGYANKLIEERNKLTKELGKKFITAIVSRDNLESQNLCRKNGYSLYETDGNFDLLYKEV
jgi:ribosomal protein S18 acetylase RimI-like enzyme